ncbi:MAG: apolipoprotein N-acyltransferase [Bacteroidota bacterium]
MKRLHLFGLSIFTGVLLSFGWIPSAFEPLLLIAFVPLLIAENFVYKNKPSFSNVFVFNLAYIGFLTWNIISTYWIYNSTLFGAIAAIVINTLFQSLVFLFFHITKCKLSSKQGNYALIVYWIGFEFLHLNWPLSWSWLTLGNGFASYIKCIQWYEYTGVLGGSLWILASNVLLYKWIDLKFIDKSEKSYTYLVSTIAIITFPLIFSQIVFANYKEKSNPIQVVAVQPNIDPYNEKFNGLSSDEQMAKMLKLASRAVNINTCYLLLPETAIPEGIWEENIERSSCIDSIRVFIRKFPALTVIVGASTHKIVTDGGINRISARKFADDSSYYESFNTTLMIDSSPHIQIYHKSKLVPGVEGMPFGNYLSFLDKFAMDLGGSVGSYGIQTNRTPFISNKGAIKIAPVICYESIFGEFVAKYVENGANIITIGTNDGWWGNTPGYKQHCSYASLRAIETRRSIARSANTGISCFVSQRGEIQEATEWWKEDVISKSINANDTVTFYVKYGDYIGKLMAIMSVLLLILTLSILKKNEVCCKIFKMLVRKDR